VGGPEGPIARSLREAAGDGDRATPDGLQPVRGRHPRGGVRRRDGHDLGQGDLGSRRREPTWGRGRGRPSAEEGGAQVRAAGPEARGLVGAGAHARHATVAPHQAPGRVRERGRPHGHEAALDRVRPVHGRDRPRCRPVRGSSSRPRAPTLCSRPPPPRLGGEPRRRRGGSPSGPGRALGARLLRARPHGAEPVTDALRPDSPASTRDATPTDEGRPP
jgi:hypothetical protein